MLSPADVTREADFAIGGLEVCPSSRQVSIGGRSVTVEPRVMQVLVLLARHRNQVVTRETMFAEIWGGVAVGDDSLNRAVSGVRKIVGLDSGGVSLETIPRTGYRLKTPDVERDERVTAGPGGMSRRAAIGGAMAAAALAAVGIWRQRQNRSFEGLIDQSKELLLYGDPAATPVPVLERAVALRPDDPQALGLLAYAEAIKVKSRFKEVGALPAASRAASAALAIDPGEPNARLASLFVHQASMDLVETEDALLSIRRSAPRNVFAMANHWELLTCVGLSGDALETVKDALAIAPLAARVHYPLAQLLWINGQPSEADRVIDQASKTWPDHRFVRFARFTILTFTGREMVALKMIERPETAPQGFSPESIALWRRSLPALADPTPARVAAAINANVEAARSNLDLTNQAVMVLSTLGDIDGAFDLTNALFAVPSNRAQRDRVPSSVAWRFAPWLFIPPTAAMRADPRFETLCDTIGLTAYWAKRGIGPDYRAT